MFPAILGQALATAALSNRSQTLGTTPSVPRQRAELMRFVKAFNRAWTADSDEARLRGSLHPTLRKDGNNRLEMRLDLSRTAQIVEWKEADVQIELFSGGQMAIVRYRYELALALHGQIATRTGRELLVLVREGNRWWIVADASADSGEAAGAGCGREAGCGPKPSFNLTPAKHPGAPRWIECDYTPTSDVCIA